MNFVRHICEHNKKCRIAEHCTVAVEITNLDDESKSVRRYIKGRGDCAEEISEVLENDR